MILHPVPDEKFIDFAYNELVPRENRFLVIPDQVGKQFKYIKFGQVSKISSTEQISQNRNVLRKYWSAKVAKEKKLVYGLPLFKKDSINVS